MGGHEVRPLLIVGERIRGGDPPRPGARAVLTDGARIAWVGADPADAPPLAGTAPQRLDFPGAEVHPALVDAHAHLTATGLSLAGLDLREARSVDDCLAGIHAIAGVTPGHVIWGSGWDEFAWSDRRPPTADELRAAGGGRPVFLSRADGHSAVMDRANLELAPLAHCDGVERDHTGQPTGLVRREAMQIARRWFHAQLPAAQLREARDAVASHLASLGVGCAHEMGGPDLFGRDDFDAWLGGDWPIEVVGYWGDLDLDVPAARELRQVGGALHLDGTIGSHTAALAEDYADGRGRGHLYRDDDELVTFTTRAFQLGFQVAYHCIGDRAVTQAVTVLERVASRVGKALVRARRPRLEHAPLVPGALMPRLADLGAIVVACPSSEQRWGGPAGLYAHRLGADRASRTHPLRPLVAAGVGLAFGSGTDLAPMDPWEGLAAAQQHHASGHALDEETALAIATAGGRMAAHDDGSGAVRPGLRADLAVTEPDGTSRRCLLTLVGGVVAHDRTGALR